MQDGPNTDGSQFFITVAPQPYLDGHYLIFGQCDAAGSVLVAQSITQVQRNSQDKPIDPVYLKKVTIAGNPVNRYRATSRLTHCNQALKTESSSPKLRM